MKSKPTYQELLKELEAIKTTNNLIEKSPIVKFLWKNKKNRTVEWVSENVKNIFGYTAEDFISGKIIYCEIIYPEDLQKVENEVNSQSKIGSYSIEHKPYRIIDKSGRIKWLNDISLIKRNENKEIIHYEGIIIDITKQKEIEQKLIQRENYLVALNKTSEILSKSDSEIQLKKFTEIIGTVAHASRTYIFKNHKSEDGELLLSQIAEYVADGIKPEIDNLQLQNLSYNDWLPRWCKILQTGDIIKGKVADFPQGERKILEPQEIKAILIIPIMIEKEFWGFIGFDNCINDNNWQTIEIEYLKASAEKISTKIKELRKQELLENENKRFHATMNSIDAIVYVVDMQTYELLFVNEKLRKSFGNKIGEKCFNALQGLDSPCGFCTNNKLLDKNGKPNEPYVWEFQNKITKQWYQCRDQAIRWTDNRLVRIEIATDITDRKKIEEALKVSENRLSKILLVANDGMWDWNLITNKVYFDSRYYEMAGYAANEFPYEFEEFHKRIHLDDVENVLAQIQKYIEGKTDRFKVEFRFKKKNGDWLWIMGRGIIVERDENNKPIRFVGTHSDITDRKKAELIIQAQNQEYEALNEELKISNENLQKGKTQIQEINSQLTATIKALPDLMFETDGEGIIYNYNAPQPDIFYPTPDNFIGKKIDEILPSDSAKICNNAIKQAIKNGKHSGAVYSLQLPKGLHWFSVSAAAKHNNNNERVIMLIRDITKSKKAEQALKESNAYYRQLFNLLPYGGELLNTKGIIIDCSTNTAKMLGYDRNEIIGKHITEFVDEETKKIFKQNFPLLLKGKMLSKEATLVCKNRHKITVLRSAQPILNLKNNVTSILVINTDLTERKKTEQNLKESEEKLQSIMRSMDDIVFMLDKDNRFVSVNSSNNDLYVKPEMFLGKKHFEVVPKHIDDLFNKAMKNVKKGKTEEYEYSLEIFDEIRWYALKLSPILNNGKFDGTVSVIRDITDRKKGEQALKESNKTKDKFFNIIAHDLKSPFNAILGFSNILLEKHKNYDDKKREKMIKLVNESANSAFKLLENLLTWSRAQTGKISYMPEKLQLKILVTETIQELQASVNQKKIHITETISEKEIIFADKSMISTILRNLISNAIKFTNKNGSITISSEKQENSSFVEISVADTGVGIPKEIQSKLFDIGENTSAKGTENETGTGLGLILCKEFVERHGGKIWLESEEGKGSTFFFSIQKSSL